jgi:hypothetical protein
MIFKLRWFLLVALTFCFLFAFRLPVFGNSAYVAMLIIVLLLLSSEQGFHIFISIFREKVVWLTLFIYVFIIIFSAFITSFNNAFDFSFIHPLVNMFFSLIAISALVSLLHAWGNKYSVLDLLVWVLILQVLCIFIMLVVPEIRDAVQAVVRTDSEIEKMQGYNGIRGLGLSGSVAFGMAVNMCVLGFVLHFWFAFSKTKQLSLITFFIFIFSLIASLATGRTAVLGYLLGFLVYFSANSMNTLVIKAWKQSIIAFILGGALILYVFNNEVLLRIAYLYSLYVFQFVWSYLRTGEATVSSLQHLEQMYFIPPLENWWFGDGYYYNSDGSHYLKTDAGYMRFLLYFGFMGSLFMYISFLLLAFLFMWRNASVMPFAKSFFFLYVLMGFILQYKGDVILYNVPFMKVFFLIAFYYLSQTSANHWLTTNQVSYRISERAF